MTYPQDKEQSFISISQGCMFSLDINRKGDALNNSVLSWGDSSVGKVIAMQARGPKYEFSSTSPALGEGDMWIPGAHNGYPI